MRLLLSTSTVLGSLLLGAFLLFAPKSVSITLNPHVGFAPLRVTGYVHIQPDEHNRTACILFASPDFASQSCKDLDGKDQLIHNPVNQVLPSPGVYEISVILYRNDGKVIQSNIEQINVINSGGSSEPESAPSQSGPDTTLHVSNR